MRKQDETRNTGRPKGQDIAARIRDKRKRDGLTQAQAAEAWNVNIRTLQDWEQKKSRPRGLYRDHIEKILSIETAEKPAKPARKR